MKPLEKVSIKIDSLKQCVELCYLLQRTYE